MAYISCASCHLDGDQDGQVWDFTDRGEGLRNTTKLRGSGWQGRRATSLQRHFDEVQDFENDIRAFFGGTGLMSDAYFNSGTRSQPLGAPKAGVSTDLDALAAYADLLDSSLGRSPSSQANGAMTSWRCCWKGALFQTLDARCGRQRRLVERQHHRRPARRGDSNT